MSLEKCDSVLVLPLWGFYPLQGAAGQVKWLSNLNFTTRMQQATVVSCFLEFIVAPSLGAGLRLIVQTMQNQQN